MVRALFVLSFLMLCASATMAQTGDPCAVMPKSNAAIAISTATTTLLVAAVSGKAIYVCGVNYTMSGTTPTLQFEYGTGATCVGTNALTGVIPVSQISTPTMNATQFVTPVSQALCAVSGGTPAIHGYVSYVQW